MPGTVQSSLYLLTDPCGNPGYGGWGGKKHPVRETLWSCTDDSHQSPAQAFTGSRTATPGLQQERGGGLGKREEGEEVERGGILERSDRIRTDPLKKATKLLYEMLQGTDGSQPSSSAQNLMRPDTRDVLSIHTCLHRCYVETDRPRSKAPSLKWGEGQESWAAQRKKSSLWSGGLRRRFQAGKAFINLAHRLAQSGCFQRLPNKL